MKRFSNLLIMIFCANLIFAQEYRLIETKHFSDNSKNCKETGNCISTKYLKNDTLHLRFYIDNNGRNLNAYRNSFTLKDDTLNLILNDTNRIQVTKVFNKSKNKMETFLTRTFSVQSLFGGPDFQRIEYVLTGFKKVPKAFKFDYSNLCDCPTKSIKFEICDNDTINMTNANGYKHGTWVEFYDTGEIRKRKRYCNGELLEGYLYDKNGKATHTLKEEAMGIGMPIEEKK